MTDRDWLPPDSFAPAIDTSGCWCGGGDDGADYDEETARHLDPTLDLLARDREAAPDPWAPKPGRRGWWRWFWEMLS